MRPNTETQIEGKFVLQRATTTYTAYKYETFVIA